MNAPSIARGILAEEHRQVVARMEALQRRATECSRQGMSGAMLSYESDCQKWTAYAKRLNTMIEAIDNNMPALGLEVA